jgi:sugar/nucleoside kinase (ribokinase family)
MGEDGKEIEYEWFGNGIEELFKSSEVNSRFISQFPLVYLAICEQTFAQRVAESSNAQQILAYNPGSRVFEDIAYFKATQPRADYIFLNEKEYGHLLNQGAVQKPEDLVIRDGQVAIITAGSRKTTLVSKSATQYISPENVKAIDETGAGDSFASAFLWARTQGYPFDICVRVGNLLASFVVQQVGCQIDSTTATNFKLEAQKRGII